MRILLATDGSPAAELARSVVASTGWPSGSMIRIATVVHAPRPVLEAYAVADAAFEARTLVAAREAMAERGEVEVVLLQGRPASAIVEEARAFDADLIVVGSRGHGPWQSLLVGSVSAEVVDHAPCPVLVVRGPVLEPIVFATDGSDDARRAEAMLGRWPHAAGTKVTVVTAVRIERPIDTGLPIVLGDEVQASWRLGAEEARQECREIAAAGAARLRDAGLDATGVSRPGDPAGLIVETARALGAGLIVVGSRGHGGVTRLLLGSVARNVLLHAPCSVLVVRPTARRIERTARAAPAIPALTPS